MYCPNCGAENSDSNAFCKKCRASLQEAPINSSQSTPATTTSVQAPPAPPVAQTRKKKGGAGKIVAVIIILVVLAGLGVAGKWAYDNILHNPVKEFTAAITAQDYLEAREIYEQRIEDNEGYCKAAEAALTTQLDAIEAAYTAGTTDYDSAMEQMSNIKKLGILNSSDIDIRTSHISEIKYSKDRLANIQSLYDSGEYLQVLQWAADVPENDSCYSQNKSLKEQAAQEYKKAVLAQATSLQENKEYEKELNYIYEALNVLPDDTELTSLASTVSAQVQIIESGRGNTVGNIVNGGLVAERDGWVYYLNDSDDFLRLYKMRTDGTGRMKLNDDGSLFINVADDWVYYQNSDYKLYKVCTDGTGRTKLNDDRSYDINVVEGWVYYYNNNDDNKIYKMRSDGTDRTKLNDDTSGFINVVDGWVYYTNYSDGVQLYKVRTDGTGRTKLNDDSSEYINAVDDWVYYTNYSDGDKLYKVRTDGTGRTKLNDNSSRSINVANGWVYYANLSDDSNLYKMRTDGTDMTKLNDDSSVSINVTDGWVYYLNLSDGSKLYKMRTDGTRQQRVD